MRAKGRANPFPWRTQISITDLGSGADGRPSGADDGLGTGGLEDGTARGGWRAAVWQSHTPC
eukprot:354946-Chlamydomonas_euryale.AAC.7